MIEWFACFIHYRTFTYIYPIHIYPYPFHLFPIQTTNIGPKIHIHICTNIYHTFTIHLPTFSLRMIKSCGLHPRWDESYPLRSFVPLGHRDRVAPFSEAASWTLGDQGHQEEYGYKICTNVQNIHDSYTVCVYIYNTYNHIYIYIHTHICLHHEIFTGDIRDYHWRIWWY